MPEIKQTFPVILKPFPIPKVVIIEQTKEQKESGFRPIEQLPLNMIKKDQLLELCEQFKVDVFAAAGVALPPTTTPA